jgi:hypothetical protein
LQVNALVLDPRDSRRLAFQLGALQLLGACAPIHLSLLLTRLARTARGWSGVIDLSALAITHAHCPPPPWLLNSEVRRMQA